MNNNNNNNINEVVRNVEDEIVRLVKKDYRYREIWGLDKASICDIWCNYSGHQDADAYEKRLLKEYKFLCKKLAK